MEDIHPKKSLREILPSHKRPVDSQYHNPLRADIKPSFTMPEPTPIAGRMARGSKLPIKGIVASVILLVIIAVVLGSSFMFSKATITIIPRQADVVIDGTTPFDAVASRTADTDLVFGTISKDFTEKKLVQATGEETVSEKASGTIIVYNAFDANPMKLIANTRFEDPTGKIYRIKSGISVPGVKNGTPGSLEVTVYADQPGETYNISMSDFTIPGLKSEPDRFAKIYARSKTAMTGGFVGVTKKISTADKTAVEQELKDKLLAQVKGNNVSVDVPAGHILIPDSVFSSFDTLKTGESTDPNKAEVSLKMSYTGILIKQTDLAQFLAKRYILEYKGEPVDIMNPADLKITLQDKESLDLKALSDISVTIAGKARVAWTFEEDKLKEALKGLSKSTYSDKILEFPAIEKASLSFTPPWIFTIPSDTDKIEIKQEISS
jgi:hypothetical protein